MTKDTSPIPRRLVHVICSLSPGAGGPPQVCAALASTQVRRGHDVAVLTQEATDPEELQNEYGAKCPGFDRVKVVHVPSRRSMAWGRGIDGDGARVLDAADVVEVHGFWEMLLVAAAARVARRKGVFVVRPAGMLDPWSLSQKPMKKKIALATTHRGLLNGRGFVHALTAAEAEHTRLLGGSRPPVQIPNGISEAMLAAAAARPPGAYRERLPELGQDPYVLFLGRLHYKKGLDRLVGAFEILAQQHASVRLVVAGPEEGAGPEARAAVQAAGLEDRVHWVGPLYGEAKQAAMQDAACFALPSRQEGFSVAVLEAMAVGCPPVITPECHFDAIMDHGAGVVASAEPSAQAAAWRGYLEQPGKRAQAGAAAQGLVASQYTWDVIAERLEEQFSRLLP